MRKLTGYIGAMIIVFALMGTILAGYALNINGQSKVVNDYETITDVSGLYTYTDEKTYIDYNPASDYIGYGEQKVYENTGGLPMKRLEPGDTVTITTAGITYNGNTYNLPNYNTYVFCCTFGYLYSIPGNPGIYWTSSNGDYGVSTITYSWDGSVLSIINNITSYTKNTGIAPFVYYPFSDYDSIASNRANIYHYTNNAGWINGKSFLIYGWVSPTYASNNFFIFGSDGWTVTRLIPNGDEIPLSGFSWVSDNQLDNGVGRGWPTINYSYGGSSFELWYVVGPRYVYSDGVGDVIGYTESERVNNYLMESTDVSVSRTTSSIQLDSLGAVDNFYYDSYGRKQIGLGLTIYNSMIDITGQWISPTPYPSHSIRAPACQPAHDNIYDSNNPNYYYDGWHNIKLSDVLASFNAPAGTTSIKITTDSISSHTFTYPYNLTIDKNLVWFSYLPDMLRDYGGPPSLNSEMNKKDYLIYDVQNNIATVYTYSGIIRFSGSPEDVGIFYYTNGTTYKGLHTIRTSADTSALTLFYDMTDRPAPSINLTATIATPGTLKYADITKGYVIKTTNTNNVIWNNDYENGKIQLLFRSNDLNGTYHNEITVSNNNISIDYTGGRFYVTLGTNEPVDIGTWRNIILNIDLVNKELSVIPVRTFNSFTNVIMDNTRVEIGALTGEPTNIIEWAPTNNSLMFNVYLTSVFMDTYGVVMVNPTLNVTDYYTDLNNFYRLKLSNFSIYGEDITINGITGTVTGNILNINDETLDIKTLYITYADGNVYIEDTNKTVDLGAIADNNVSLNGAWYFNTTLSRGYTAQKMVYDWDWSTFIFDNVQFCIMYIGFAMAGLIIARKYCNLSIIDYMIFITSIIVSLTIEVIV